MTGIEILIWTGIEFHILTGIENVGIHSKVKGMMNSGYRGNEGNCTLTLPLHPNKLGGFIVLYYVNLTKLLILVVGD